MFCMSLELRDVIKTQEGSFRQTSNHGSITKLPEHDDLPVTDTAVVLCVLPLCLSLCSAGHASSIQTWPASAHQLPFKHTWFPCSRPQIGL